MKKNNTTMSLGVLSIFLISQAAFIVNPALAGFAEQYSEVSYSTILLIATLPSLIMVPCNLIGGAIVGKKIKYRTLAIFGCLIALVGGIIPFFVRSFPVVLASRALFGIGNGLTMPLGNALVLRLFKDKSAGMLGAGNIMQNVTGVVIQNLAGIVCARNLNATWLCHLFLLIPLILMTIFLPEPEKEVSDEASEAAVEKKPLPFRAWLIAIVYGVMFIGYYPLCLNMSAIITGEGMGTAAAAGTVLSFYTVGGMIAGAIFGVMYKVIKHKLTLPVCLILYVLPMFCVAFGHNLIMFYIGITLSGIGVFTTWSAAMMDYQTFVPAEQLGAASGIFAACLNAGAFGASPFTALVANISGNSDPRLTVVYGSFVCAVLAVLWIVIRAMHKPQNQ
ncbi:MAG: MFS transporter [Firmicutes bacterium]|nr:MFS transporter [Bacillota bacterium]